MRLTNEQVIGCRVQIFKGAVQSERRPTLLTIHLDSQDQTMCAFLVVEGTDEAQWCCVLSETASNE